MAGLEKSKKTSKKQKIDRRSNLEQEKIKNLIHRSEVCKMENQKGKNPKERPTLEKGAFDGRRIDLSYPIIFPSNRTIEGLPIATYKKAPATRIGASGISICIAFRYPRKGTRSKMPNPLTMNVRAK